jgi:tRNA 2-selenouridine synthase
MGIERVEVDVFLQMATEHCPILDVRSPAEFAHAHFPGAVSFPLFTNEERKVVGTTYKQQSREDAIKVGVAFFGPKMATMISEAEAILKPRQSKKVLVHCWRGGMRSAGVAWLLDLYGFEVYTVIGGYKAFRNWALQQFETAYAFNVLGGYTGSGKTYVLQALQKAGKPVVDLEAIASHKGSAFGSINMPPQPSQEMFENTLALALHQQASLPEAEKGIWIEDESQRIGQLNIPHVLWNQLRAARIYFLEIDFEKRLEHIVQGYGKGDKEKLVNAIIRIQKRLGGLETKTAINFLLEDNILESFRILLQYYDKHYYKGLHTRDNLASILTTIPAPEVDPGKIASQLKLHLQET